MVFADTCDNPILLELNNVLVLILFQKDNRSSESS